MSSVFEAIMLLCFAASWPFSIAKSLLAEGIGVSEVCERCGFSDYSNFLKAFTKSVGISPKKYSQYCNK